MRLAYQSLLFGSMFLLSVLFFSSESKAEATTEQQVEFYQLCLINSKDENILDRDFYCQCWTDGISFFLDEKGMSDYLFVMKMGMSISDIITFAILNDVTTRSELVSVNSFINSCIQKKKNNAISGVSKGSL